MLFPKEVIESILQRVLLSDRCSAGLVSHFLIQVIDNKPIFVYHQLFMRRTNMAQ